MENRVKVLDGQDEAFDEEFWVDGEPIAFELPPAGFEYEEDEAA